MMEWLNRKRRMGSAATKHTRLADEVLLLPQGMQVRMAASLNVAVGKEWKRIPTRSMMELVNLRFGTKSRDYAEDEMETIFLLLGDLVDSLGDDQLHFLARHDHLPRSKVIARMWMSDVELEAYGKNDEEVAHQMKMNYFVASNGLLKAAERPDVQNGPKKPIMSATQLIIAVAIAAVAAIITLM